MNTVTNTVWQKWRISAPQTLLWLIIRQMADSASIRQPADGTRPALGVVVNLSTQYKPTSEII